MFPLRGICDRFTWEGGLGIFHGRKNNGNIVFFPNISKCLPEIRRATAAPDPHTPMLTAPSFRVGPT